MMKRLPLLVVSLLLGGALAGAAFAQQYRWVDKDGRTQYGDFPPPGVKATPLRAPSGPAAPAAGAKGGAPLSATEQDAAFRKRQADSQKEAEKSAQADRDAVIKKENCARAQANLRALEGGQRISTVNAQGERVFLEDAQIASETARARQAAKDSCS